MKSHSAIYSSTNCTFCSAFGNYKKRIKRLDTGGKDKDFAETIIAKSEYLAHRAQQNFQTANIIKAALKLEASVTNAATYYFSSIEGTA